MKDWWEQLAVREQVLLAVSAALLCAFLLVTRVWEPLNETRRQLTESNRQVVTEVARARQLLANVTLLRQDRGTTTAADGTSSPEKEIESAVARHNLRINRLQPNQDGAVQLWLKNAPFAPVSMLLQDLEEQRGFNLRELALTSARETGKVDLRVKLQK